VKVGWFAGFLMVALAGQAHTLTCPAGYTLGDGLGVSVEHRCPSKNVTLFTNTTGDIQQVGVTVWNGCSSNATVRLGGTIVKDIPPARQAPKFVETVFPGESLLLQSGGVPQFAYPGVCHDIEGPAPTCSGLEGASCSSEIKCKAYSNSPTPDGRCCLNLAGTIC